MNRYCAEKIRCENKIRLPIGRCYDAAIDQAYIIRFLLMELDELALILYESFSKL